MSLSSRTGPHRPLVPAATLSPSPFAVSFHRLINTATPAGMTDVKANRTERRACAVCGSPASQRCSACGAGGPFYCSSPCQKLVWPLHKKACGAPGAPCYLPPLKEEEYQQMQDLASAPFFVKAWPLTKASGLAIGGEGQSEQYIRFGLWKGKWHNLLTYLMQESCGIKEPKRSYLLALLRAFAIGNSFETLKPHIVCTPEHVWSPIYTLSTLVAGYFEHMHSMTTCFPGSSLHNKFRVAKFNIFHAAAPFLHQVELFHYLAILAHSKKRPAALTGQVLHHAWTRLENILDQEELRFASLFRRSASASDVSDDEDELSKMGEEYMRGMVRKDFAIVRNEALKELGAVHLITEPRSSDRDEENERAGDHDACRTQ